MILSCTAALQNIGALQVMRTGSPRAVRHLHNELGMQHTASYLNARFEGRQFSIGKILRAHHDVVGVSVAGAAQGTPGAVMHAAP